MSVVKEGTSDTMQAAERQGSLRVANVAQAQGHSGNGRDEALKSARP